MTYQTTKWGERELSTYLFMDTPFGDVELINFHKTGPDEFTILLDVPYHVEPHTHLTMRVTWWNCDAESANAFFGIEANEQGMWGEL